MRPGKWHALAVGLLFLVLAGLSYLTSDPRASISGPESVLREVVTPVQTGFATTARWSRARWRPRVPSVGLQEDNRLLRQEVAALRAELQALEEHRRENQRLREIAGLREYLPRHIVVAQVVARPYNQWFSSITLNRGSKDGLRPGLPVVNAQGVVGHVESVTANTARVLLLTDPKSAVGGMTVDRESARPGRGDRGSNRSRGCSSAPSCGDRPSSRAIVSSRQGSRRSFQRDCPSACLSRSPRTHSASISRRFFGPMSISTGSTGSP